MELSVTIESLICYPSTDVSLPVLPAITDDFQQNLVAARQRVESLGRMLLYVFALHRVYAHLLWLKGA